MSKPFLLIIAITPLLALAQTNLDKRKTGELIIHGTISNIEESVPYVYSICLERPDVDSTRVVDQSYTFRLHTGVTTLVTLFVKNPRYSESLRSKYMFTLVAEPSTITISSKDSFSNATVTGSQAFIEFSYLNAQREPYSKQLGVLYEKSNSLKADEIEKKELLATQIDSTRERLCNIYYDYIKAHPSSLLIPYALDNYMRGLQDNSSNETVDKAIEIYSTLSTREKDSYYGKKIKKKIDSYKVRVGMPAPPFVQNDTAGHSISLSSFRGKYVLLNFWGSWCIPCRREHPELVKVFNAYKDKGFTILSISLERPGDKEKWLTAIHNDGLTWTHVSDFRYWDNEVARRYKIEVVPQNFLLDPSGVIIAKGIRGEEIEKKIRKILGDVNR